MKKPALLLFLIIGTFYLYAQNNCLNFDGLGDYVSLPDKLYSENLKEGTELTIEYWFKGTQLSSPVRFQNGAYYVVAGWGNPPKFIISSDDFTNGVEIGDGVKDGKWHHIACVWKSNTVNGFQTYVDGVLTNQRTSSNATLPEISSGAWLGSFNGAELLNGTLDEVRIWKVARTQSEIRQNMYRELPDPASETNLVAYYKLNETGGTSAADAKGSYDGSLTNYESQSGYWQTSPAFFGPKNCLNFNGTDDYVSGNLTSSASSVLTIEFSVYFNDLTNQQNLLYISDGGASQRIVPYKGADNVISLFVADVSNNGDVLSSDFSFEQNKWYHLAFVYNNQAAAIYVNGLNVASKTMAYSYALDGSDLLFLGSDAGGGLNSNVKMDEVRIWNTARTLDEIRENMCKTLTGNESGLIAYYNFDNTINDALADFSGKNNDGTLNDMSATNLNESQAFNTWLNTSSTSWNTTTNWSLGSVPASAGNVGLYDFSGGSDPVIPTGQTLNNLVVGSGVTTQVSAGENLTINGNFFNYGNFTVSSTGMGASSTGSLIVHGEAAGSITFQRYADVISKGEKWHYVSAPVSGQSINTTWMTDNNIGFTDPAWQFFRFSELYNYWIYFNYEGSQPEDFGDETFIDARGYCLTRTSDGVLSFSGTPVTENVSYAATYNEGQGNGFNLVGNPFTSAIGVTSDATSTENFLNENAALLDDSYEALYIWDEAADYTFGSQDYKVICNADFSGEGSGLQIPQDYIAPGQAFMVKVVSGGGDLVFNTNMQVHNTAAAYKSKETWPFVELTIRGNETSNTTAIGFHSNMTNGLDRSYDAAKFKGNPYLSLYTKLVDDNGKDFAVQALPDQNIEDYIVPIGVDVAESGTFEFSAMQEKLDNYSLLLEDRQENTFTDLRWETYSTTISESGTGRFYLHFKDATAIGEITPETKISFKYLDGKIQINNPDQEKGNISLVNITGQVLGRIDLNGNPMQEINLKQAAGIYIISIQTEKTQVSRKVFIK